MPPHILAQSGSVGDKIELNGYEFNDGSLPWTQIPMKSKTRAFLDTMKLLDGLTAAQIQTFAKLARSLGGVGQSP